MKYIVGVLIAMGLVFGAWGTAPPIKAIGKVEGDFNYIPAGSKITPADTIAEAPDIRTCLGTPGKNIAVRGDTVVVIFGPPSTDPDNIFRGVKAGYSFDGGHTWQLYDLSTNLIRRCYPGVIWPENWDSPLFFWMEASYSDGYQPAKIYVAWDLYFPMGLFNVVEMPNSQTWNVWLPSADASGDTIIVTGVNIFDNYYSYIWRSYDHGTTWEADTLFTEGETHGYHDTPIPRIGHNGYVAMITDFIVDLGNDNQVIAPYFAESMDGGQTWSSPMNLWDACGGMPYDSANGWWYVYDFVLDNNDKPHIIWKFSFGDYEYGDIWYFSPGGGSPGAWTDWSYTLLVGIGDGSHVATQPTIAYDPNNDALVAAYKAAFLEDSLDTIGKIDVGLLYSSDLGNTWVDYGTFSEQLDTIDEEGIELPALISSGVVHVTYFDEISSHFMHASTSITGAEEYNTLPAGFSLKVSNPVSDIAKISFTLPIAANVKASLYDAAGRLVRNLVNEAFSAGAHELTVNTSNLAKGLYFVYFNIDGKVASAKLAVVH